MAALFCGSLPAAAQAAPRNAGKDVSRQIAELRAIVAAQQAQITALTDAVRGHAVKGLTDHRPLVRYAPPLPGSIAAEALLPPPPLGPPPGPPVFSTADKKIRLGGLTITPGGFLSEDVFYRSKSLQSDVASLWATIPMGNSSLGHTSEFKESSRNSRLSLLAEGNMTPSLAGAAFFEADLLASGTTSNNNVLNRYVFGIRHLYTTVDDSDLGLHLLAGQAWSLVGLNSMGITPRNEVGPPTADAQPMPGVFSARQPQLRLTKDFDKTLWLAVSVESPQTTFGGSGCTNIVNNTGAAVTPTSSVSGATVTCLAAENNGAGQPGSSQQFSLNTLPDVVGKIAYEARVAHRSIHLEALGMYRNFYDRVDAGPLPVPKGAPPGAAGYLAAGNRSTNGYAGGVGLVAQVVPNRLDFVATWNAGTGIGRYGAVGFQDATLNPNGSVRPIPGTDLWGGFTLHASPAVDIYLFGGSEGLHAAYSPISKLFSESGYFGYGQPNANDTGCAFEGGACTGNARRVQQITGGVWDKVYRGSFGTIRVGLQYSYTVRTLFPSSNGPHGMSVTPSAAENIVMTSFRYYPFQ